MRSSWWVGPDQVKVTRSGEEIGVVSREAQIQAIVEAAVMADHRGGVVLVLYGRKRTGFPDEAVTTELVVTWQDRAQADRQLEQDVLLDPPPHDVGEHSEQQQPVEDLAGSILRDDEGTVLVGAEDESEG